MIYNVFYNCIILEDTCIKTHIMKINYTQLINRLKISFLEANAKFNVNFMIFWFDFDYYIL